MIPTSPPSRLTTKPPPRFSSPISAKPHHRRGRALELPEEDLPDRASINLPVQFRLGMDNSWIMKSRTSEEFVEGFANFLKGAFKHSTINGKIKCPCRKCSCRFYKTREEVETHVVQHGFILGDTPTALHSKSRSDLNLSSSSQNPPSAIPEPISTGKDDVSGLIQGVLMDIQQDKSIPFSSSTSEPCQDQGQRSTDNQPLPSHGNTSPSVDRNLHDRRKSSDVGKDLYPGSKISKSSFAADLVDLKNKSGWPTQSFNMLVELLGDAFPQITPFPSSFQEVKKMAKDVGGGANQNMTDAGPDNSTLHQDFAEGEATEGEGDTSRKKQRGSPHGRGNQPPHPPGNDRSGTTGVRGGSGEQEISKLRKDRAKEIQSLNEQNEKQREELAAMRQQLMQQMEQLRRSLATVESESTSVRNPPGQ